MKNFKILSILSVTFFLLSCNNDQKAATDTIKLVADYNMTVDTAHKLKICTKGTSTACDSKDAILIEDLTLRYPGRIGGNFILQVTSGPNHVGEYIGLSSADWQTISDAANAISNPTNEQTLRKFFNENFQTFGFLTYDSDIIRNPNNDPAFMLDKNGNVFSETGETSKDIETIGAHIEGLKTEKLGEILNINYGLSEERAQVVARNVSAYQRLSSKRSLTEKEKNYFSNEILGVNYNEAQRAITSGSSEDLNNLLEKAAGKNGTSPEQVSEILSEILL